MSAKPLSDYDDVVREGLEARIDALLLQRDQGDFNESHARELKRLRAYKYGDSNVPTHIARALGDVGRDTRRGGDSPADHARAAFRGLDGPALAAAAYPMELVYRAHVRIAAFHTFAPSTIEAEPIEEHTRAMQAKLAPLRLPGAVQTAIAAEHQRLRDLFAAYDEDPPRGMMATVRDAYTLNGAELVELPLIHGAAFGTALPDGPAAMLPEWRALARANLDAVSIYYNRCSTCILEVMTSA